MNTRYVVNRTIDGRWVVWYKDFKPKQKNKLGVYKIYDCYKDSKKNARFAIRYIAKKDQSQEDSDNLVISKVIANFYKSKPVKFNIEKEY